MREAQIEKKFAAQVKKLGGVSRKWSSPSHRGVPDRIVFWGGGLVHFVELKAEEGRLSKLQEKELQELRNRGMNTFVLTGWYECELYLKTYSGRVEHVTA